MPWLGARPHKPLEALGVRGQRQACPGNPLLYLCSLYNFVADINTHHRSYVEEFDYPLCGFNKSIVEVILCQNGQREKCSFKCERVWCDLVLADRAGGGAEQLHHGQPSRLGYPEAL